MTGKGVALALVLAPLLALALTAAWVKQPGVAATPRDQDLPAADAQALRKHVDQLAGAFARRDHAHVATLNRAASYIERHFLEAGGRVERQTFSVAGFEYVNVVARFGPKDGNPVVVGAHYDVQEGTPGADDNASGVAGLLELARLLARRPPAVPVELVAYTLEEMPYFRTEHMGSRHHAESMAMGKTRPLAVVVLEMIGYFSDEAGSQRYPLPGMTALYPDRGDFIAIVGPAGDPGIVRRVKAAMTGASPLPVQSINAPTWIRGIDFSDHASYWRHGMPAVMVTDTAFYRNPHYHQATDRPDTLDYRRMAFVVDGVLAMLAGYESQ